MRFHDTGRDGSKLNVVTDPADPKYIGACEISTNEKGQEMLFSDGTHSYPLEVVDSWDIERIIEARNRHMLGRDGKELSGMKDILRKSYSELAAKPPVMYTGKN